MNTHSSKCLSVGIGGVGDGICEWFCLSWVKIYCILLYGIKGYKLSLGPNLALGLWKLANSQKNIFIFLNN